MRGNATGRYERADQPGKIGALNFKCEVAALYSLRKRELPVDGFVLLDSLDTEHEIDVLAYPDYTTMVAAFDSVEAMTGELHWFKYEAGLTWLSGAILLVALYYMSGGVLMIDPIVAEIGAPVAMAKMKIM